MEERKERDQWRKEKKGIKGGKNTKGLREERMKEGEIKIERKRKNKERNGKN